MNTHPEAFGFCPSQGRGFDTHGLAVLTQRSHAAFREKALIAVQDSGSTFVPLFQGGRRVFCGRGSSLVCTTPPVVPLAKGDKMRPQAASVSLKG